MNISQMMFYRVVQTLGSSKYLPRMSSNNIQQFKNIYGRYLLPNVVAYFFQLLGVWLIGANILSGRRVLIGGQWTKFHS